MSLKSTSHLVATSLFISACLLMAGSAIAQDVQVRSEVVVSGSTAADDSVDGVIVPDLLDEIPGVAYTDWVSPDVDRDFQTIDFLPKGGLLVRDGLFYMEFLANGMQKISDAFPINCTKLRFDSPKGQGLQDTFLSDCSASLVRNDNTMRICGSVKGQGLKCIAYDLDSPGCPEPPMDMTAEVAEARTCGVAVRTTAEPPPQLTDAVSDDSDFVELRWTDGEPRILIAGDRKSIFAIRPASRPITIDSEDTVETIATFGGGLKVNAFTTLKESLIVAFESGELRKFNLMTGVDEPFYQHPLCGDRKTPQGFALRSGPNEEFVLALNRACGTVTVLDLLGNVVDTDGDMLENPFVLSNSSPNPPGDFLGEGVVARAGESGTFLDCIPGLTCQLGQVEGQVTQSNTTVVQQDTFDPGYRIFQSYLSDCRFSLVRPCPIVNCPQADDEVFYSVPRTESERMEQEELCPPQEEQVLNLTELTLRAETSGDLAALLPDPPPVVTIPAYLRGDESYPRLGGGRESNNYEFYSLWAVSEVLITDVFDLVIDVDLHRLDEDGNTISDDPSDVVLPPDAGELERLVEVADRSNAVIHNRDTYNTVPRIFKDPENLAAGLNPTRKGGVLIDADTGSKRAGGYQWSAVTYGLQTYYDRAAKYLELAKQQLWELQAHKDEFLCSPFVDPEDPMNLVGPVLGEIPCDLLQSQVDQFKAKTFVCHAALLKPQQGSSRENCNALFTKIDNALAAVNDPVTIPPPTDVALITPNYLGEWESRLQAYRFTTEEWLLPVTPTGGIPAPATDILQPADGSSFLAGDTITFEALAEDQSPVVIDVTNSIEWTSNRDGPLRTTTGGGPFSLTTLSEGVHIITARAFDEDDGPGMPSNPGSASVVISVAASAP